MKHVSRHESVLAAAALAAALAYAAPAAAQAELTASPALPAYGQAFAVEVKSSNMALYLPATRYTRNGSAIEIDYDYLADSFGPFRPDFGQATLPLGELAPGDYRVHARLHDIAAPGAAPIEVSMQVAIKPPDELGIYMVPRAPQAFSPTEAIVRSAVYFDPSTMRARILGNVVRVDFDYSADPPFYGAPPGMSTFGSVRIPGLAPGSYRVEGWGRPSPIQPYEIYFARAFQVAATVPVIEYYAAGLGHYFIAAGADEIALLDRGAQGDWKRTGQRFDAWLRQSDAPAGAVPVCRFYASGPNSHFYTGSAQECAFLRALEQQQRAEAIAHGEPFLGWAYEATAFWAGVPVNGACPAGMSPVYRAYNGRAAQMDSNHRFMASAEQRDAMSVEWLDEGAQLCAAS